MELKQGDRVITNVDLNFGSGFYREGSTGTVESIEKDLLTVRFDKDNRTGTSKPVWCTEARRL